MDLIAEVKQQQVDYSLLKQQCIIRLVTTEKQDISVIIPVHGRTEFHRCISDHFRSAIESSGKKISLTFVEHSCEPLHRDFCAPCVNYIWIPQKRLFNKSLAHNMGALFGPASDFLLFHDVDIIVPPYFFQLLFQNIKHFDALQTFTKRRLWQLNEYYTGKLFIGEKFFDVVPWSSKHVTQLESGASGGSMFIKRKLFENIGGFDDELFTEYSIEDQMFFDKIQQKGTLGFCDNPPIQLVHLYHAASFNRTTKNYDWDVYEAFKKLSDEQREKFYQLKREHYFVHSSEVYREFIESYNRLKELQDYVSYANKAIEKPRLMKELLKLGEVILPWLIDDYMKTGLDITSVLLRAITQKNIIPDHHAHDTKEAAKDWYIWYETIYKR